MNNFVFFASLQKKMGAYWLKSLTHNLIDMSSDYL